MRKGETVSGQETAKIIRTLKDYLPSSVQKVLLRADAEFMCWDSVKAALDEGYDFIFSNKQCEPPFDPAGWYRAKQKEEAEFNSCIYKSKDWKQS